MSINAMECPAPFLSMADFPAAGGEITSRFCSSLTDTLVCCLPCPLTDWLFDPGFPHVAHAANYIGLGSFIANCLLLLTYLVLPEEQSHRHYLSIGLTGSLLLMNLAFVIPIGTKPDICLNAITPNNMYSDMSCAWTGALLLSGAMGLVIWILLRSVWFALRVVLDFKRVELFKWISLVLGIGVPALFLAIAMPVTGVSYRIGTVCIPNGAHAFVTWFVWLLIFAGLSAAILGASIVYCLWKFARSALGRNTYFSGGQALQSESTSTTGSSSNTPLKTRRRRHRTSRFEWRGIKRILSLQWRSIVLAFVVLNETIFFGNVFIDQTNAEAAAQTHINTPENIAWAQCIIANNDVPGGRFRCLGLTTGLGLSESRVIGTLMMASMMGLIIFALMVRWSMVVGWWELVRHPRAFGRKTSLSSDEFIIPGRNLRAATKHMSLSKTLASEVTLERGDTVGLSAGTTTTTGESQRLHVVEEVDDQDVKEDRMV